MAARPKSRFWRLCRIYFRRFRMTVWLIVLALLGSVAYLNQVGLPNFVKKPLLQKLRARGVDLQFSRLRLRLFHGIVAENVRFGRADDPLSPKLTLSEVDVQLNHRALAKLQLQVDSLILREGRLVWPIAETNRPLRVLSLNNIQTDLRLLPNDQWALDNFTAAFAGGRIQLSGNVTNASAVRDWRFFQAKPGEQRGALQNRLRRLADGLERIAFSAPPELKLHIQGDARDPQSFLVRFNLSAPGSETPWGAFTKGSFTARLHPATSNGLVHAEVHLEAADAQTPWATATNLHLSVHLLSAEGQTNVVQGNLTLSVRGAETKWGSVTNAQFSAEWVHSLTNPIPISGRGELRCEAAESPWANAKTISLTARMSDSRLSPADSQAARGGRLVSWWTNFEPHLLDWECHLAEVRSPKLELEEIDLTGQWRAPRLLLTIPQARLYHRQLAAKVSLDAASRFLKAELASDVDPHKVSPVLTEGARRWLSQFSWSEPPEVAADVTVVLPAWTNQQPDWRGEVLPTLTINGQFKADHGGAYRELPVSTARSHFAYSNMCWSLPDLTVIRPEGRLDVVHKTDDRSKDFYWKVHSTIDVTCVRPLLATNEQRALDVCALTVPPVIDAEIWGRWRDYERLGLKAQVALTNFTFREQSANSFRSAVAYTNRLLRLINAEALVGPRVLSASELAVDLAAGRIFLTNGFSTADPRMVTRAIGPKVDRTIEPYRFLQPPTARVHGIIPIRNEEDADLHFDINGGPFQWMRFNVPVVSGHVHWKGDHLTLSGIHAGFYGGEAAGSASFDFRSRQGAAFQFDLAMTNTQLKALVTDLAARTNNLEGLLSGRVIVNSANTADSGSWQGGGNMELRDGLIWEIPVFGVFSPVLNGIAPGLGNSRASAATGTFSIVNGVIRSDDLEIRTTGTRLRYRGTVNFEGQVNARMEAELLRDMWVVGPIISTVFGPVSKLFEYKVSGTLSQPKTEPVFFIPKIVLMPFHPLRTLKELFPQEPPAPETNAPPVRPN
jgi:hypothetical protein